MAMNKTSAITQEKGEKRKKDNETVAKDSRKRLANLMQCRKLEA